jgi:hypothetical protein
MRCKFVGKASSIENASAKLTALKTLWQSFQQKKLLSKASSIAKIGPSMELN